MPDHALPPRWRLALRIVRGCLHALVAGAGVAGLVWQPSTIAGTIGEPLTYWWTLLAALGGMTALVGVIIDRWTVEWLATWPAIGGTFGYALSVWGIVSGGSPTRAAQAFVVTALFVAISYRSLELAAHAAKLRAHHPRRRRR